MTTSTTVKADIIPVSEVVVKEKEVKSLIMEVSASTLQNDFSSKKLVAKIYGDLLGVNPAFKKNYISSVKSIITNTLDNDYIICRVKKLVDLAYNIDQLKIGVIDDEASYRCKVNISKIHLYNIEELVKILKRLDQIRSIDPEIRKKQGVSLKKARGMLAEISTYIDIEGKTDYNNSIFGALKDLKKFLRMEEDDLKKAEKLFNQAQKLSISAKKELLAALQEELKGA